MGNTCFDPQDTFFRNTLYVSNNADAFNTVLVNVAHETPLTGAPDLTCVADASDITVRQAGGARVTATVRNNRSGRFFTVELVGVSGGANSQAYFKIVEDGDTGTLVDSDGTVVEEDEEEFPEHGGPTWCDNDGTSVQWTTLTASRSKPLQPARATTPCSTPRTTRPLMRQEIATIFAKHGDRLTVTTSAGSGQVQLVVDGDGPDFSAITPEDNDVMRSSRLTYSFEVRDDDSGLRHDGEADHHPGRRPRPRSTRTSDQQPRFRAALHRTPTRRSRRTARPPKTSTCNVLRQPQRRLGQRGGLRRTSARPARGASRAAARASPTPSPPAARTRTMRVRRLLPLPVERARPRGQLEHDRRGRRPGLARQPAVRVPRGRHGPGPDGGAHRHLLRQGEGRGEEVDRSYIALTFTDGASPDAIGDVDTDNITVVGHTDRRLHPPEHGARHQPEPGCPGQGGLRAHEFDHVHPCPRRATKRTCRRPAGRRHPQTWLLPKHEGA